MTEVRPDSEETLALLERAALGDRAARNALLERHRERMHHFVEARLDARLRARLSASDVVQEAQLEVTRRMDDFLRRRPMPFHLWVRRTAYERLLNLRRRHRQCACRSVDREEALPERSLMALARPLLGGASPSEQAQAAELAERVGRAWAGRWCGGRRAYARPCCCARWSG